MSVPEATHATKVFHVKGQPIPIIFDENELNIPRYDAFMKVDIQNNLKATEVYEELPNKETVPRGIVITLKIKSPDDYMEFIIIPDDEFITELVAGKRIYFGNSKGITFFSFLLDTKPIENVWEPSEKL